MQVILFAGEEGMLLHMKDHIQITRWAAEWANFSRASEADASAVFDAWRNLGVNGPLPQNAAFAFALRARIGDDAAGTLAGWASASDAEESLLVSNLSAAIA